MRPSRRSGGLPRHKFMLPVRIGGVKAPLHHFRQPDEPTSGLMATLVDRKESYNSLQTESNFLRNGRIGFAHGAQERSRIQRTPRANRLHSRPRKDPGVRGRLRRGPSPDHAEDEGLLPASRLVFPPAG